MRLVSRRLKLQRGTNAVGKRRLKLQRGTDAVGKRRLKLQRGTDARQPHGSAESSHPLRP